MGKFISGLPTRNSLDRWHTYAKQNSYHPDRAQLRNDLSGKDATKDVNEMPKYPSTAERKGKAGPT
jgi:hypothetical protein